jgi:hypothetical protein
MDTPRLAAVEAAAVMVPVIVPATLAVLPMVVVPITPPDKPEAKPLPKVPTGARKPPTAPSALPIEPTAPPMAEPTAPIAPPAAPATAPAAAPTAEAAVPTAPPTAPAIAARTAIGSPHQSRRRALRARGNDRRHQGSGHPALGATPATSKLTDQATTIQLVAPNLPALGGLGSVENAHRCPHQSSSSVADRCAARLFRGS